MEKVNKLGEKKYCKKSQNLIFNLKLLPFISIKQDREFYLKKKEYLDGEIFNILYLF